MAINITLTLRIHYNFDLFTKGMFLDLIIFCQITSYAIGITIRRNAARYSASPDIWFHGMFTEKPINYKLKVTCALNWVFCNLIDLI